MSRTPVPFALVGRGRGVRAERFSRLDCSCHRAPHDPNAALARRPVPFPGSEADLDATAEELDDDLVPKATARAARRVPAWPRLK